MRLPSLDRSSRALYQVPKSRRTEEEVYISNCLRSGQHNATVSQHVRSGWIRLLGTNYRCTGTQHWWVSITHHSWFYSIDWIFLVQGKPFPGLINATIHDLATGLDSGLFTSVDLVKAYIARIMEVNSTLHMVAEINPDALAIAADLDTKRARGTKIGPLHGIPILIKNNIATKDKMDNTAGSWALFGSKVPSG